MKILLIGDIHGDIVSLNLIISKIIQEKLTFDHIVLTGDIGIDTIDNPNATKSKRIYHLSVEICFRSLQRLIEKQNNASKVLFVHGNHDSKKVSSLNSMINIDILSPSYEGPYLDDSNGMKFIGIGGSTPTGRNGTKQFCNEWDEDDKRILDCFNKIREEIDDNTIIISHVPPFDTLHDGNKYFPPHIYKHLTIGSKNLKKLLYEPNKPRLLITGHMHQRDTMLPVMINGIHAYNAGGLCDKEFIIFEGRRALPMITLRYSLIELAGSVTHIERHGIVTLTGDYLLEKFYIDENGAFDAEHNRLT